MDIFHRHRQSDEPGVAAAALERALQTAEYRPEALIWKGIEALPRDPELAFIFFANAIHALPQRADLHALIGRSLLAQGHPTLATRYLTGAWRQQPNDPALRMVLWQARSQSETPAALRRLILAHLPDITAASELTLVLKLLAAQAESPGTLGVVRYLPDLQEIHGWAIDLRNLQAPVPVHLEANGVRVATLASAAHPLLGAAGLPAAHGGIRIKVPNPTPAVHVRFETGLALLGSPVFAMPAFVPPPTVGGGGIEQPVDVLIPVYDGLNETLECINSALAARKLNRTPHRLVVIDDATPLPALSKALKLLANKGKITLLSNAVNLGFIGSMNRAMGLSPGKDVVWLNADTRVHGNWLDRLRKVAYSDPAIASVTPFTNNGELMSFPQSQISQPMPTAQEQAELDDLARLADSPPMEIETGCGFCLYIKREAIDQVGYLDDVHLSRGYGEETDWCLRARALGWRHMGAPGVFVAHQGGISFGEEKILRVAQNNAVLRRRYADASSRYQAFVLADPIRPARQALQRARLARMAEQPARTHNNRWPALQVKALHIHDGSRVDTPFSLTWHREGQRTWVTLQAPLQPLAISLDYELPADLASLSRDLRILPVDELVFEQLDRCPVELCDLPTLLDKPYRIVCRDDRLLSQDSAHDWQHFAHQASSVQLPWNALRQRYAAVLPDANLVIQVMPKRLASAGDTPRTLLIGDDLRDAGIARQWLALARRITRQHMPLVLLAKHTGPWFETLLATGALQALPKVPDFTLADCALATGCAGVLSLDPNPGAGWLAPALATALDVPLYAMPGPVADEAEAMPLTHLPFSLSPA